MTKRLGSKYWQDHLKAWKRSGLTQVAYCATHELCVKTFSRWRGRELATVPAADKSPALTLVPASVSAPAKSGVIQLHSPGGWRIELPDSSTPWLSELLRQLP